ncbi:AAA domain-containing protein [Nakamurella leprariae]|uniref:AAA family ATPase n=1 Tax=Nakamurella leprariae TaxID=2803911 RepID=A0A938YEU0_9ACTN|nr:AAA domain-containing protein [Nakamurella leprariae]MBM9466458.1 AAA family ATPase [Nakamurella leprariae]
MVEAAPSTARDQALNLIDYLAAYESHRHPSVRRIADHGLFRLAESSLPVHEAVRIHPDESRWLTVDFIDLPAAPEPPDDVAAVLVDGASISPAVAPHLQPPPEHAPDRDPDEVAAAEDEWAGRTAPALAWIDEVWRPWSVVWGLAQQVKDLHRNLFEQHERLAVDRDSVELVWGFGHLRWTDMTAQPAEVVDHPLLSVPVEVAIDRRTSTITVTPAGGVEVDDRVVRGLDVHDRAGFTAIRQAVVEQAIDPWNETERDELLRRLVRAVDHRGELMAASPSGPVDHAVVTPSWTVFLRRRLANSEDFLEAMRQLYRDDHEVIPPPLRAILTTEDPIAGDGAGTSDGSGRDSGRDSGLLMLPLPANEQQQRILRLASFQPGVVVQGPPGTGKSHTIANLISHFVAEGRRVLVVAEKEQALSVLSDKIPEEIRDLAVSVLGADEESRRRLGNSIQHIQTRVGQGDARAADARITQLMSTIDQIDRRFAELTHQLRRTRRAEVEALPGDWLAGASLTPQVAAAWVAETADRYGEVIADPIGPHCTAPLSSNEFTELVSLLASIGTDRADQAGLTLPDRAQLPSPEEFAALVATRHDLRDRATRGAAALRPGAPAPVEQVDAITELAVAVRREVDWRRSVAGNWIERVLLQYGDARLASEWGGFIERVTALRDQVFRLRAGVRAHDVRVPSAAEDRFEQHLREAAARLAAGGKLGLFARDAKRAVESCTVDGRPPATAETVQLCIDALVIEQLRHRIAIQWQNQVAPVGGPALPGLPEETVTAQLDHVLACRQARQRWEQLRGRLDALGVPTPDHPDAGGLASIASSLDDVHVFAQVSAIDLRLDRVREHLERGARSGGASPLWRNLAGAVIDGDQQAWTAWWAEVEQLAAIAPQAQRLRELRGRLAAVAPVWAEKLARDPGAVVTADFAGVWQWRQLDTWLTGIAALPSPSVVQAQMEQTTQDRQRAITELVAERAWHRLLDNLGHRERQALQRYVAAVNRFGKTGGKYANRWIAEMRTALEDATTAVPVWIMPVSRALTNFRPTAEPSFDVLIVDEASQIGFEALPLLALARTTIIVGDDKQTSPENVGLNRERVFELMDDFLRDIHGYRTTFDPDRSLYDLAMLRFSSPVMLTEHFRSLPPIIEFSNRLAYDGKIVPLRDRAPRPGWRPLRTLTVEDGYRIGFVNKPEADAVVDLLERLHRDPACAGMSFGVITLLGTAQSKLVWDRLFDRLGPEIMQQRAIRVGEPANFQGDERDVMVVSTVIAPDPSQAKTRHGAMTSAKDLRRINVAASRARNQMWVVTSVSPNDLLPGDHRAALIRHCLGDPAVEAVRTDLLGRCESEFERKVVRALLDRGYRDVAVQYKVGQYRLDIVVTGPESRLAIECDGDRWHGEDAWESDRARQQVLERAGWTFERIRGSAFFRDPAVAMEPVWRHLEDLGIPTGDWREAQANTRAEDLVRTAITPPPRPADEQHVVSAEESTIGEPALGPRPPVVASPPSWYVPPADDEEDDEGLAATVEAGGSETAVVGTVDSVRAQGGRTAAPGPVTPPPSGAVRKAPYRLWTPRQLTPVSDVALTAVREGLAEIVEAEGPMHADRAYRLYVTASGGQRVGREIRRLLDLAVDGAVRRQQLQRVRDRYVRTGEATLYPMDVEPVLLRERGPRDLTDIPRGEVRTLMGAMGPELTAAERKRAVLREWGFGKLSSRLDIYLDECLTYG